MSNNSQVQTIVVPWRKLCAALPAVALIFGGLALTEQPAAARDINGVAVATGSPAIVVPDTALTMPGVPVPISADPFVDTAPKAPALVRPKGSLPGGSAPEAAALVLSGGTLPGSPTRVAVETPGIPVRALEAYREATSLIDAADPACHIDWALLAAIGRVESNHARFGGNQLDAAGVAQPGIIGIPLDGHNSTARITDSDGGRLDRDGVYDRAVGPMQFIPSTWRVVGTDADGDGVKNPQDMADAATATAIYLCSGPGDLNQPGDLRAAIMRYNASDSYVRMVTAIADAYRHGVSALPASDLPAANSASLTSGAAKPATAKPATAKPATPKPATAKPATIPPTPVPAAPPTPVPAVPVPAVPVPAVPVPAVPVPLIPCLPIPAEPTPAQPVPCTPVPAEPVPCLSVPAAPVPASPVPAAPVPAVPVPVPVPVPCPIPTAGTSPTSDPSPTTPLTQEICNISPLGVKSCTIVPLGSTPTSTP